MLIKHLETTVAMLKQLTIVATFVILPLVDNVDLRKARRQLV
jgi:hypothetical protein